jgi:mono/diheme cytochrome c family protein
MLASAVACRRPAGEPSAAAPPAPEERLASRESVVTGHDLFLRYCAPCHGARGQGDGPRAGRLSKAPADLTTLPEERRDPRRLFTVLHDGVRGSDMPSWRALDEEELWDLVAYLRSLGAGPGAATEAPP